MKLILADTSVWIDALNGNPSPQAVTLSQLIEENAAIAVCPTIVQEILQGIKEDKDFNAVKNNLQGFILLPADPLEAAYGAAQLYRKLRKQGITIRKANDCLIAWHAIHHDAHLLHIDEDFDQIARHTTLKIFK